MSIAVERAFAEAAPLPTAPRTLRTAAGGLIDRARPINFIFDGRPFQGLAGDTLASALLANGVRLVGRSFKYHRPRGILSAGSEEPNALVELRSGAWREPNTRATVAELFEGLEATSQNRWPSLRHDLLSVNLVLSPVFAAGFYYKTFMWPAALWERVYEPLIRRAAGLGRAAGSPDPDHYERMHAHCDVLVAGGGPSGLAAALAAARSGARVILVDETDRPGGRLLSERREIDGLRGIDWVDATLEELRSSGNVEILVRTTLFGIYDHGQYGAVERVTDHLSAAPAHVPRQRSWRIVAKRAIVAAGAIERPIVFGDNDRPGVMLAGAVRSYVNRYGVLPGREIAIFTSCDDGWRTAGDVTAAGGRVAVVVDCRGTVSPSLIAPAERAGARIMTGARVTGTSGGPELRSITVSTRAGRVEKVRCDCLAVSNGWNPVVSFDAHVSRRPVWNDAISAFVPDAQPDWFRSVGAAAGTLALVDALAEGTQAGRAAAAEVGFRPAATPAWSCDPETTASSPTWRVARTRGKAFVDFQNDVTDKDIELAHREGFRSVEHLKRYTTLGMATDQGKTSNVSGMAIMAELTGQQIPRIGSTVSRPPYAPVALGALAGHHTGQEYRMTRLTPSHRWCERNGAVFVNSGVWKRAAYFPRPGETDWAQSVSREVSTVRSAVGICDVSTFGKIDFQGSDALALIEMAYANPFGSLAIGRCRYALMLREDGFVLDDGTIARLGENHYVATASTANAARAMQHLEFVRQWLRPDLDVQMTSTSEQWAQFAIAGPRSRDTLRAIVDGGADLSNGAVPFLACRELRVGGGIEARLFRISFSGELAYELAVPARYGEAAWNAILEAGRPYGIAPYGTEAVSVMRIEKGHPATAELNGMTTARDLGLDRMLARKKDYVGRLMKEREALTEPDRPVLVGVTPVDPNDRLRAGSHFVATGATASTATDEGYLTSTAFSPSLGRWIGLGLLKRGARRHGEMIRAFDPIRGGDAVCKVCAPCFVDPREERSRA